MRTTEPPALAGEGRVVMRRTTRGHNKGSTTMKARKRRARTKLGGGLALVSIVLGVGLLMALPAGAVIGGSFIGGTSSSSPTISSDQPDYNPGQTVTLTGNGWDTGGTKVHIVVNDAIGQTWQHTVDVAPDSS